MDSNTFIYFQMVLNDLHGVFSDGFLACNSLIHMFCNMSWAGGGVCVCGNDSLV